MLEPLLRDRYQMMSYYFFIEVESTPEDTITTGVNPLEEEDKLEFVETYLHEHCRFHLLDKDEEQEMFELCTEENYTGYPSNTIQNFHGISHLIEKAVVCRLYEKDEFITINVYNIGKSSDNTHKYEGVSGARGYDAIDKLNKNHDLTVEWDWNELERTIPTALNI